jgi:hypothetical protein
MFATPPGPDPRPGPPCLVSAKNRFSRPATTVTSPSAGRNRTVRRYGQHVHRPGWREVSPCVIKSGRPPWCTAPAMGCLFPFHQVGSVCHPFSQVPSWFARYFPLLSVLLRFVRSFLTPPLLVIYYYVCKCVRSPAGVITERQRSSKKAAADDTAHHGKARKQRRSSGAPTTPTQNEGAPIKSHLQSLTWRRRLSPTKLWQNNSHRENTQIHMVTIRCGQLCMLTVSVAVSLSTVQRVERLIKPSMMQHIVEREIVEWKVHGALLPG